MTGVKVNDWKPGKLGVEKKHVGRAALRELGVASRLLTVLSAFRPQPLGLITHSPALHSTLNYALRLILQWRTITTRLNPFWPRTRSYSALLRSMYRTWGTSTVARRAMCVSTQW